MLETQDLILDKARLEDWKGMYQNVWSHPESARYMQWEVTTSEEAAKERVRRSVEFQRNHDVYFVYLKTTGEPIGFAGVEELKPEVWGETGICLGPDFVGKGYGWQLLQCLLQYAKERGAKEFIYSSWEENRVSKALAAKAGFQPFDTEEKIREHDEKPYVLIKYRLGLV